MFVSCAVFQWIGSASLTEIAVRFNHPFTGPSAIIPDVFGMGKYTSETLGTFAFVNREPLCATLPRCLRNHLNLYALAVLRSS
jgi:hypothetical protein